MTLLLTGCSTPQEISIFAFDFKVRNIDNPSSGPSSVSIETFVAQLENEQRPISIDSLIGTDPCKFAASFEPGHKPAINFNGEPGQVGYNIGINFENPKTITTENPPSCPTIEKLSLFMGGRQTAIDVGGTTQDGRMVVSFADNRDFDESSGDFFEATLTQHSVGPRRRSAEFIFISRLPSDQAPPGKSEYLFGQGSFTVLDR